VRRTSIRYEGASRINGAVESRANAITIAGFVRCHKKKVGHVICGRAKEDLVGGRGRDVGMPVWCALH